MPIMKLPIGTESAWIPFPHEVHRIYENPGFDGCYLEMSAHHEDPGIQIKGHTARQVKREIQENVDVETGFLKTFYVRDGKTYTQYYNVKFLEFMESSKDRDDKPITLLHFRDSKHIDKLLHDPAHVALQLRRIIKRLDQDEELCCAPPAAPEENDAE